jgi:hypothetical protein
MDVPQKATITAVLFGALVLAGHPLLADAADSGNDTSVFAQVQGQQDEEATSGRPPATTPRGMGPGMMGPEDGMMGPEMRMRMRQMHPDMMGGPGMHGGMMGGMGPAMAGGPVGPCPMMARTDKDFSAEQVRDILEGQIAWTGNERLKVGSVERKDNESFVAEIVTIDDSLVQRVEVDRSTGAMRPID